MSRGDRRRLLRTQLRMGLLLAVPGVLTLLVAGKAVQVQVVEHAFHSGKAARQQAGKVREEARRGSVFDRRGVILAHSAPGRSVRADPGAVTDPGAAARALGKALEMGPEERVALHRRLAARGRQFAWVKRNVTPREAEKVAALRLEGVEVSADHRRYWPNKELAGQVLGLTDADGKGIAGLELGWEDDLSGTAQVVQGYRDARRNLILASGGAAPIVGGNSLVLTIDAQIQHWMETEIELAMREFGARSAVGLALDPKTGDILAMASVPRFNPNAGARDQDHQRGRAATDALEFGSVVKPLSLAAALAGGVVTPDSVIDVEGGRTRIGGFWIRDVHKADRLTPLQCVEMSSNVCMAKLALLLGRQRLHDTYRAFGVGASTGSGIVGEAPGFIADSARWSESRLASMGYGYGFRLTALQLAAAFGALGNQGLRMRPRLVSRILGPEGEVLREIPVQALAQATTPAVAAQVASAMEQVIHGDHGTAKLAKVPGYRAAAKTGTARKVDPVMRKYVDKYVSTLVGFAPVRDPRVVVVVSLDEPRPLHYAGRVAGVAFSRIMSRILAHLEVPPDDEAALAAATPPPPTAAEEARVAVAAARAAARAPVPGLASAGPGAGADGGPVVPDFRGMSLRSALVLAGQQDLDLVAVGGGRAVSQNPSPGAPAGPGVPVRVEFDSVL